MAMTTEQFETLCAALADKIKEQDTLLILKDYEISNLNKKLAEAEGMEAAEEKNNEPF